MTSQFWKGFWFGLGTPIGWALCHLLYWLGHYWNRIVMPLVPDEWERTGEAMAGVYCRLMGASLRLNYDFGLSVWRPAQRREDNPAGAG